MKKEELTLGKTDRKYVVVCDNAAIHKSKLVKAFLEETHILMVTIPPYCPVLNPVEKLILAIKQKVNKYEDEGR